MKFNCRGQGSWPQIGQDEIDCSCTLVCSVGCCSFLSGAVLFCLVLALVPFGGRRGEQAGRWMARDLPVAVPAVELDQFSLSFVRLCLSCLGTKNEFFSDSNLANIHHVTLHLRSFSGDISIFFSKWSLPQSSAWCAALARSFLSSSM